MSNLEEISIVKNDKKTIKAWAVFDWANSAYSLVISTAIFPVYYTTIAPPEVTIGGSEIASSSLFTFSISFAYIVLALASPILSGMADYAGKRKFFLRLFTIVGALGCIAMFWFDYDVLSWVGSEDVIWYGTLAFILATIGYAGGLVFYDSFLPLITTEDQYDKVSAKGFSYGYIGSVILLVSILIIQLNPEWFGITNPRLPSRIGFLMVGLWWLGFAQYTITNLPKDDNEKIKMSMIGNGYREIMKVMKEAMKMKNLKLFLLSLFLYYAGVQTVIYVATIFADQELKMETSELIMVVLIIQLIGIVGAYLFAYVSSKIGNKKALLIQIAIWAIICVAGYFVQTKVAFYCLAGSVGMVVGGIQSLSRASYSKLLKKGEDDVTSFFSLYDVLFKFSIVGGTFLFGVVNQITGDMRYSVMSLAVLFILGFIVMTFVSFDDSERELNVA